MSPLPGELSIKVITFIISYILNNPNTEFRILLILAKTCKQLQYSISNVSSLDLSKLNYSFRHLLQLRHRVLSGVNHAVNYARIKIQVINESRIILSITYNISSLNLSHSVDPFRLLKYSFRNLSLLRHLDLSSISCTNKEISHVQRALIISSFTHLESFKYNDNDLRLLRLCLRNLPNLKALYLSHVDIGKYGDILSRAIGKLTDLTTLDISGTIGCDYRTRVDRDMVNHGMKKILSALPSSIKTLNFTGNTIPHTRVRLNGKTIHKPLKNDEMRAVANGLSRLSNLTTLDLSRTCINTKFMRILEPALCGLTQLKILHLDHIHDSYRDCELFILLANVIKVMTQLEILTLESNYLETSMTELCSAFRNLDKLKKLELKNTRSNSVGFSSIITVLPYMTSLTYLGLESTGCNDIHIPLLWNALSNHTALTTLNLSNNNIGDEYNTEPHFECLTPIPKLLHLNLSYNNLNKKDMERILIAQTELKTLAFSGNAIDREHFTFY